MKIVLIVLVVLTGILLFSTTVCGLWLKGNPDNVDDSSRTFHMSIALLTVAVTVITLVLSLLKAFQALA